MCAQRLSISPSAPSDVTAAVAALMIIGAGFELGGIVALAWDIRAAGRRAETIASERQLWGVGRSWRDLVPPGIGQPPTTREIEDELYRRDETLAAITHEILIGDLRRRRAAVAALVLGLAIATVANVLSVVAT